MGQFGLMICLLLFLILVLEAEAQSVSPSDGTNAGNDSNFEPSLAVVVGILCLMFSLTCFLLFYAKFCKRRVSVHGDPPPQFNPSRSRTFSGVDKTVIESLPFFRFSSLKGSKQGLECSVCLSKFEDVEILRLLPKCKHAFHISCIDQWLEKHSSCPLCRHKVNGDDPSLFAYSTSMRFLNQSDLREDSSIELYVQREEEDQRHGSSRFSIGSSFRKIVKGNSNKEEASLIQLLEAEDHQQVLHKFNHKIMVSDHFVFKNRWSSVSSSDLMCLNSEMLNAMSNDRFSWNIEEGEVSTRSRVVENEEISKIKEEIDRKRLFENKVSSSCSSLINKTSSTSDSLIVSSRIINSSDRRSVSEITAVSRYANKINDSDETNQREERIRRLWLPIARRTVQWFANREKRSQQTTHHLDV